MDMAALARMQCEQDDEDNGDGTVDCQACRGTGLPRTGPIDVGSCPVCRGRGYFIDQDDDYDDYGEERWDD